MGVLVVGLMRLVRWRLCGENRLSGCIIWWVLVLPACPFPCLLFLDTYLRLSVSPAFSAVLQSGGCSQQAHALTPLLTEETPPEFPFLNLLVSGGHTMLVLAVSEVKFVILAKSLDDSIG